MLYGGSGMSDKFEKVKEYYIKGFWSLARVKKAVEKQWITQVEFKEITGRDYIKQA